MKYKKGTFLLSFIIVCFSIIVHYSMTSGKTDEIGQPTQSSSKNEAWQHYERGADFLDQKKYDNCIRESEIAIKSNPKLDGAYCNLGSAYFMKGDYDNALFYLEKAFELNSNRKATRDNLVLVYEKLGKMYLKDNKYKEALKMYLKLLELKPKDTEVRVKLGTIHYLMGSKEAALQEYQEAVEIEPDNPKLYLILGSAYIELKLYDKAIETFKGGIKVAPDSADLHYELGATYYDKGLIPEAIEETKQAIKLNPDHEGAKRNLKALEGVKDLSLSLKTDTLEGELNKFLLERKQTLEDAFSSQVLSIDFYPPGQDKPNLYMLPISTALAFIDHLCSNNRYEDVVTFCEQVIKSIKDNHYPYYKMGIALEALGRIDEAIEAYKKAKALPPDVPLPYFRLWGIYKYDRSDLNLANAEWKIFKEKLGNVDKETQEQTRSFIVRELFSVASYHLNISREMDKAIKEFLMILELEPEMLEVKYNLATSYLNKGSAEENKLIYQRGIQLMREIIDSNPDSHVAGLAEQQLRMRQEKESKIFSE